MKIIDANVSLASKHYSSKLFLNEEFLQFLLEFSALFEEGKTNLAQMRKTATGRNRAISDTYKFELRTLRSMTNSFLLRCKKEVIPG